MTYNELAELFKREDSDAQVCFSIISQNQMLFGNNDTKKDIISLKNEEPIKWVKDLQEEPVSIWHDASEKPNIKEKSGIFVITLLNGKYIGSRYYNYDDVTINFGNYDKWAYLNDLVNLSNVQRTAKDWKEPVSEYLEKAAKIYSYNLDNIRGSIGEQIRNAFKAGAEWGRNQTKVEIQAQSMALAHGCPKESINDDLEEAADNALSKKENE
jgi:hypothetical protein